MAPGPQYLYEYVSACISMDGIVTGQEWELDFTLTNRGDANEFFKVEILQAQPDWESIVSTDYSVAPLQVGGYGLVSETDPHVVAYQQWWARIFTTSLNLTATMRFIVYGSPTPNPPVPTAYFGPNDFAVFQRTPEGSGLPFPLPPPLPYGNATRIR